MALFISALGLYGVMAYLVSRQTREIGIRMALGADRWTVLREVLRRGAVLASIGSAFGLLGAFVIGRVLESFLYLVKPYDPAVFVSVTVTLCAAALAASYVPARRASKLDPMTALRHE